MDISTRLLNIDRRILYLLLAAVVVVPLLVHPSAHPPVVFKEVSDAYKTIQDVPDGKIVLVSIYYGAGTMAENGPQTEVLMRHMFKKHIRFAVLSWDVVGTNLSYDIGRKLQKEYGAKYGSDWVHLGYRPGPLFAVISGMAENFPKVIGIDRFGTKVGKIEMLKNVKSHKQIGTVVEVTPSGTVGTWIAFFTNPYHVPLVYAPTAVMVADAYPYLDSKQINGMLNGVIGAAQYETLIGMENQPTFAAAASLALSCALVFIIVLVIIGNVAYWASKRAASRGESA
jgi:hypothetical protein